MAQRSTTFDAVILRSRETSGGARIITLLADEAGLVDAFVFGGPKSRLRSLASPWHAGRAWIYRDSAKDMVKLTDFDAMQEFPTVRQHLATIGAAALASEFLVATSALGGDWPEARQLFCALLEALDKAGADAMAVDRVLVLFCARAVGNMGLWPDPAECSGCGGIITAHAVQSYTRQHGAFLCPACACAGQGLIELPRGALVWLIRTGSMDFGQAARVGLAADALSALKACLFDLLRKTAESPLRTLESGLV
jgi:DNA repair protein RecO (recombination protein O)